MYVWVARQEKACVRHIGNSEKRRCWRRKRCTLDATKVLIACIIICTVVPASCETRDKDGVTGDRLTYVHGRKHKEKREKKIQPESYEFPRLTSHHRHDSQIPRQPQELNGTFQTNRSHRGCAFGKSSGLTPREHPRQHTY